MPTIYDLKPRFQALLRPLVIGFAQRGITANQVTVAALLLSCLTGAAIVIWPTEPNVMWLVPVVMFVRMALNAIDGMLAREHDMKSNLGSLLNEVGDVVSDVALYLPFAFLPMLDGVWVMIVVALVLITEVAGLATIQIGASRRYDGPMGKSDRAALFGLLAILIALQIDLTWQQPMWMAVCALLVMTTVNRMRQGLKEAASCGNE